jgi:RNA recognition motif-containing protein
LQVLTGLQSDDASTPVRPDTFFGKEHTMNKRLYVGNLSNEVTENDLTHNFSSIGKVVSVAIIKDKYSRQSKGFGFVEMETEDEAKKAIEQFNGGELQGKKIVVSEAREPRKDGEGGGFNRGGGGGGGRPGGDFGRGGPRRGGGGGGGYGGGRY